jgi:type II secretory pathway predicted ATPase ExeA
MPVYEPFYLLNSRPFLTVPDPDFLHWTDSHSLAFTMLRYGMISRAPITVVTGEIGAGKTTLLRQLLREVPDDLAVGLVSNMQAGRGELLQWIMMALGQGGIDLPYVALFQQFQDYLIKAYAGGKRVVLVLDEAQNLGPDQLEELRMLSNINADKDELLQLVLVGQPQLRDLLSRPDLTQFSQRITADFHLSAMQPHEVDGYIQHRLAVSGAQWRIFPKRTCDLIHVATGGVPRLINILCDLCLVYGFSADRKVIEEPLLREFLGSARSRGIYNQFAPLPEGPSLVHQAR